MSKNKQTAQEFINELIQDVLKGFLDEYENITYFGDWLHEFIDSYFIYYDDDLYKEIYDMRQEFSEAPYFFSEEIKSDKSLSNALQIAAYFVAQEELYDNEVINKLQNWDNMDDDEKNEILEEVKDEIEN